MAEGARALGEGRGERVVAKASPVSQQNYLWCVTVWSLITCIGFSKEPPQMLQGESTGNYSYAVGTQVIVHQLLEEQRFIITFV